MRIFLCLSVIWGVLFLSSCANDKNTFLARLYDEKSNLEIVDSSNYEIISFNEKDIPDALGETLTNPRVWFGGGIPFPSRKLESLKSNERGVFNVPKNHWSTSQFLVILNKDKDIVRCYNFMSASFVFAPWHPKKENLSAVNIYDLTWKDISAGEDERRAYYKKLFDDICIGNIRTDKKNYNCSHHYVVITEDRGKGEKYVAPLYIDGSNPPYSLPCREEFDDKGEMKNFFNLKD